MPLPPQLGRSRGTRPIRDPQGRTVPGSVARLEPLTLGGVRQWLLVRGRRAESPILLKLHGGPGQAEMATVGLNGLLENDFVVVEWDQRGSGKSGAAIEPAHAGWASSARCGTALRTSTGSVGCPHPSSTRGPRSSDSTERPNALSTSSMRTCCP